MKHFLLLTAFSLFGFIAKGQVVINGDAPFADGLRERVTVIHPIGRFASNGLMADTDCNTDLAKGHYRITVPLKYPGWIFIRCKTLGNVAVLAFPGQHFTAHYQQSNDSLRTMVVRLSGPNAAGWQIFTDEKLLHSGPVTQEQIVHLLANANDPQEAIEALTAKLAVSLHPLDSLKDRHVITPAYHRLLKAEMKQWLLFWNERFLISWLRDARVHRENPLKMDSLQVKALLSAVYRL